jgi:hypothetical protein
MSIWIRIANSAFTLSLEKYTGFAFNLCPYGFSARLGCVGLALFWNLSAVAGPSKAPLL